MSVPQNSQTVQPFLRQAAFSVIGLGCLLAAGSVLSSVAKTPLPKPTVQSSTATLGDPETVYALPLSSGPGPLRGQPLKALVRFHNGTVQITNNSCYPWRNVRVQFGSVQRQEAHSASSGLVVPYHTCAIPMDPRVLSSQTVLWCHRPFTLRWECRTAQGRGRWQGYLTQ